jgi:hypothetical protein
VIDSYDLAKTGQLRPVEQFESLLLGYLQGLRLMTPNTDRGSEMKSSALRRFVIASLGVAFAAACPALKGVVRATSMAGYKPTSTMKLGGAGGWDYVTLDDAGKFLYVTRTTHTMVVEVATGKTVHDIAGQERSHGVALVPAAGRGFISDGKAGAVLLFDLNSGVALGEVAAADDADSIIYDPASNRVLVFCGDAHRMVAIAPDVDPKSGKASAMVDLGGSPEFAVADGFGKVFVNI